VCPNFSSIISLEVLMKLLAGSGVSVTITQQHPTEMNEVV